MRSHFLKNALLLLVCIFPSLLYAAYWTPWTEDVSNPVYSPLPNRAYYPSVQYDPNQFSGHGASADYKMWSDNPTLSLAISYDGINWATVGTVTGLTNPRHSVVLYDANSFGNGDGYYYQIWYWNSAITTTINGFRHAKSVNGIDWVQDNVCAQDGSFPLVDGLSGSYFKSFYGPSTVLYNANATNNPSDPMTYKYVVYYIGSASGLMPSPNNVQWDNVSLAYSADGITWKRYGILPVLLPAGSGWDANYATSASVVKTRDMYHMWYSGSTPAGSDDIKGIGYATSIDGINWVKASTNPIFKTTDGMAWRDVRTYASSVLYNANYFGVPSDNIPLKMWFSGKSTPGVYSVGYATAKFSSDPGHSTLTAVPTSVLANGTSTSNLTVTLKSSEDQPIVGNTVTLAANHGSSIISAPSGPSDANGQVRFTVKDAVVETVTYAAKDTTNNVFVTQQATVAFQSPQPPSNLRGKQLKNDFGTGYELYNLLEWGASPTTKIEGYNIYRDFIKITSLRPSIFRFEDHNRKEGVNTRYSVTSFIGSIESMPINISIQ